MPLVFVWGNGRSPVITALGHHARRPELDPQARLIAAQDGDFDVPAGGEHGMGGRWAHAIDVDDLDAFAESIRDDSAILEWTPDESEAEIPEGGGQVLYPFLRYRDAAAAIDWLTRVFGFEVAFAVPDDAGGIAHAQLLVADERFMLSSLREDGLGVKTPEQAGGVTSFLHVAIDDVEAHFEHARAAGAEIISPLGDTGRGSRGYTVLDLEGHIWRFDTYAP